MTTSALEPRWSTPDLHAAVKDHYDGLIDLYEDLWGEHIHHGYWAEGETDPGRHAAQVRLVDELISFGPVTEGARVLDAGCGIGASAVYLAQRLGCTVDGITLSAEQITRAEAKAAEAGVPDLTSFRLVDAMHTDYPEDTFDLVWALESCEIMPDKKAFLAECKRVLKPGGTLLVATWCARDDRLAPAETRLLQRIYRDFVISHVLPLEHYAELTADLGLTDIRTADWSPRVWDTWKLSTDIVKPVVRDPSVIWKLVRAKGMDIFRFLNSVPLMKQAYDRDVMRYGVFRATKPL
ncbi:methyltransferase domain-containing protein [Streptomyces yaanensis]|uniref:Methyltransferase domain-containing protein n=1 Tax=Streptomyces yaanensis TaxID=1142239 RepID=A0ABV7SG31_9ACTN|nr:methyltransferase domain-containing protein [Streptomyces sp. CGMCC 4.7035]WNB99320.1 methyltransferase domain-containing protein [Streptomyces sp. CGMCC 4.7035]